MDLSKKIENLPNYSQYLQIIQKLDEIRRVAIKFLRNHDTHRLETKTPYTYANLESGERNPEFTSLSEPFVENDSSFNCSIIGRVGLKRKYEANILALQNMATSFLELVLGLVVTEIAPKPTKGIYPDAGLDLKTLQHVPGKWHLVEEMFEDPMFKKNLTEENPDLHKLSWSREKPKEIYYNTLFLKGPGPSETHESLLMRYLRPNCIVLSNSKDLQLTKVQCFAHSNTFGFTPISKMANSLYYPLNSISVYRT